MLIEIFWWNNVMFILIILLDFNIEVKFVFLIVGKFLLLIFVLEMLS